MKRKSLYIVELKNTLFFLISFSDLLFKVKRQGYSIQDRKMARKVVSASVPYEGQHLYSTVPVQHLIISSNIDTIGYIPTHFSKTVKVTLIFVVVLRFWGFLYFLFSFFFSFFCIFT